jgi:hypothetical protein
MTCEHYNVTVEEFIDVDDNGVLRYEHITCCDCGADLVETRRGQLVPRKQRRAA